MTAVHLITTTSWSIKAITASVGYSQTAALDHVFGDRLGVSPNAFRNE